MSFTGGELISHEYKLMTYAVKFAPNREEARDFVQTTYMRAIRYKHSYKKEQELGAWLMAILKNVINAHYVKMGRSLPIDNRSLDDIQGLYDPPHHDTYNTGDIFDSGYVNTAFDKLKPIDKEIILLTYVEGKNDAEISEMLNLTPSICRGRRRDAKRRFKEVLLSYRTYESRR